ncbi:multidrug efflux MFS transporter [Reyranella soli]|nr:multidrug efflux MFS transporter [Reyranella soli]
MFAYYMGALEVRIARAALALGCTTSLDVEADLANDTTKPPASGNDAAKPDSGNATANADADIAASIARRKAMLAQVKKDFKSLKAKSTQPIAVEEMGRLWNEANRIERLTVYIEPTECLWEEVRRRLGEAADENILALARLQGAADMLAPLVLDSNTPGKLKLDFEDQVRALLLDILEETHWDVQRKFYSRPIRKVATRRIVCFGTGAFLMLLAPFLMIYFYSWWSDIKAVESWSGMPLYAAVTAGLFGALFSRLLYLQQRWDTLTIGGLKDARDRMSIVLRGCVGMTGAVVVFFFMMAKVVDGPLFPNFQQIGLDLASYEQQSEKPRTNPTGAAQVQVATTELHPGFTAKSEFANFRLIFPSKNLALLIVWSFLAGFSERLVPTILQDTEASIRKKAQ